MGEAFAMFFIVIAVMAISLLLFSGWIIAVTFRGVGRILGLAIPGMLLVRRRRPTDGQICNRCRQMNPPQARFCRRCGESL